MSFDDFMKASIELDLPNTIVTVLHSGSIEEQMFIHWAATIDFGYILAYALNTPSPNNHVLEKHCHRIIFNMELKFSADLNGDEERIATNIINDVSNVDKKYTQNIIAVLKPTQPLIDAIISAVAADKSGVKHIILINPTDAYHSIKKYENLYVINVHELLSDKIQNMMFGVPNPFQLNPLYFSYAILALSQSTIFSGADIVKDDNFNLVNIRNLPISVNTLSQYVCHVFNEAVPRTAI